MLRPVDAAMLEQRQPYDCDRKERSERRRGKETEQ
jgi:hypothetical protein